MGDQKWGAGFSYPKPLSPTALTQLILPRICLLCDPGGPFYTSLGVLIAFAKDSFWWII